MPADRAAIHGSIHDENDGRRIAGALVMLHCSCLSTPRETWSDTQGRYSFVDLPPGSYSVQALYETTRVQRTVDLAHAEHVRVPITIDPVGIPSDERRPASGRAPTP